MFTKAIKTFSSILRTILTSYSGPSSSMFALVSACARFGRPASKVDSFVGVHMGIHREVGCQAQVSTPHCQTTLFRRCTLKHFLMSRFTLLPNIMTPFDIRVFHALSSIIKSFKYMKHSTLPRKISNTYHLTTKDSTYTQAFCTQKTSLYSLVPLLQQLHTRLISQNG